MNPRRLPEGRLGEIRAWLNAPRSGRGHIAQRSLFEPDRALRPLTAVVSEEVLTENADPQTALLLGLLHDDSVHLLRYADGGPPESAHKVTSPLGEATSGWVVFEPHDQYDVLGQAITTDEKAVNASLVFGGDLLNLAVADGVSLYASHGPRAEQMARADVLAGLIADDIGGDLLVTKRPILLQQPFALTKGVACLTPASALPIVSLYLRRQGQYIVHRDEGGFGTHRMNRGLFFWVAARDLLPSGWKWMSACTAHSRATEDDTMTWLAGSLHRRLVRALQARDKIHAALLVPQTNDSADEALGELDVLLVGLMGMVDVAARVTHLVLGLGDGIQEAAWQRVRWRRKVEKACPELVEVVADGSVGLHVLSVLRLLRNSIHGEALPSLTYSTSDLRHGDTLVGLPRSEREKIQTAVEALGGAESWGIREVIPGRLHADIRRIVERLLPAAAWLTDSLLSATPVERLASVDEGEFLDGPPDDDVFAAPIRERIRLQLGL